MIHHNFSTKFLIEWKDLSVNTSISATEFSHTEHISNSHSSRSSTSFNDTENPSTSSANRAARPSVGSSDRNPELPPLKVTVVSGFLCFRLFAFNWLLLCSRLKGSNAVLFSKDF